MSGTSLPWSSTTPAAPTANDPAESLRRIEYNTGQTLQWVKYLVYLLVILIIVNVLLVV
jgi:hypothetical protein